MMIGGEGDNLSDKGVKMTEDRWRKLEVWELADDLAFEIYQVSRNFPKEEIYGITSQIRRAALSIPTNIVEGYSRKGDKELSRFINISLGSLAETKYLIYFSHRLKYLANNEYNKIKQGYEKLGKRLWRFYESVRGN
jgi:four helix bundle protein